MKNMTALLVLLWWGKPGGNTRNTDIVLALVFADIPPRPLFYAARLRKDWELQMS